MRISVKKQRGVEGDGPPWMPDVHRQKNVNRQPRKCLLTWAHILFYLTNLPLFSLLFLCVCRPSSRTRLKPDKSWQSSCTMLCARLTSFMWWTCRWSRPPSTGCCFRQRSRERSGHHPRQPTHRRRESGLLKGHLSPASGLLGISTWRRRAAPAQMMLYRSQGCPL